jgi:hypothetical protein
MVVTIARPRPTPAWPFGAALERFGEGRDLLGGERVAGVLDREEHAPGADGGVHPDGAVFGQVVDDRVLHEVRGQLEQECLRAAGGGEVAVGLDGDAVLLGEGEERFGGLFRQKGQVDVFSGEGPLAGAAEQEQRLGEVDGPGVHGVKAVDEFARVVVRIGAGHVEQCLRDRQRGAQLVRGVGRESLLCGNVCFELREHRVEGVGEFPELVAAARQLDAVGERSVRGRAGGVCDAGQGGEHAAGEDPPSYEAEHQQERQHRGRSRRENVQEGRPDGEDAVRRPVIGVDEHRAVGDIAEEEHPHRREQQGTGQHEEPGVAEGEFEPDAQPGRPSHDPPPRAAVRRCGSRRPARWR